MVVAHELSGVYFPAMKRHGLEHLLETIARFSIRFLLVLRPRALVAAVACLRRIRNEGWIFIFVVIHRFVTSIGTGSSPRR
jgi:hypothetical protein